MTQSSNNISVEKKEDTKYIITGEIPVSVIETRRPAVLRAMGKNMELPGFRKGHIPEKVLVERLGEDAILREIAEVELQELYPEIIKEHSLHVVGRPEVNLTKLAPGNPITFSIEASVLPPFTLPDYKQIARSTFSEKTTVEVTKEDVDTAIEQILKSSAPAPTEGDEETKTPELTEEIVKNFGDFATIDDFKNKLKESLKLEKERQVREKKRVEIGEAIIRETTLSLPAILIEGELEKMLSQLKSDVEQRGMTFDAYLTHIRKSEEDIRNEWREDAKKRAQLQLILNKIAVAENIQPDKNGVDREIEHIRSHVKDADPERVRIYVETMFTNEEVFRFLERQGDAEKPDKKQETPKAD